MGLPSKITDAWSLLRKGDHRQSLAVLGENPLEGVQEDSLARALVGAICVRAGDLERGLAALDGNWSIASADASGLAGAALLGAGQFEQALAPLHHAVNRVTQDPGAHLVNLGRALVCSGRPEEALAYLQRGIASSRHSVSLARQSLAEAYIALGRLNDAVAAFPEDLKNEESIIARGSVLAMAGRHDEAERFIIKALEQWPESVALMLFRADLCQVRGRDGMSTLLILKALEKEPESIELLARLAQTGPKGMAGSWARKAADKARDLAEDREPSLRALAINAQAYVLAEDNKVQEAEAAYREALTLVPGFVPALSGLGILHMQNGKIVEAMECFYRVRAVAPLHGWTQLIQAREVPEDLEVLQDIEQAARQPGLDGPVRSSLLYTLAAAWDKKGDFDRAMSLAVEANEASKRFLTYNPTEHRKRVEREISRFSAEFMRSRAAWGLPSSLPVFVTGMPRSGTTLTEQILGSHSQISGAGELSLVAEQIARLEAWEQYIGSQLTYPECVADLTVERSHRLATKWLESLREFDPSAAHVVDKLPHNFEHIGLIKLLFPNAIIFHCKREARDIAVSNYVTDYAAKFSGMGFAYDLGWIGEQLVDHDRLLEHWHEVFPDQIFEVVYEELVEDTETWARRMIDFMGLAWEPEVLKFQDLERPVKTASAWQVRQPVYTSSKARWRCYAAHLGSLEEALKHVPPMPAPAPVPLEEAGLFGKAMAHLNASRLFEARNCFLRVISANPGHAAAHHFLGATLLQQGNLNDAVHAMRHAVKLLPEHPTWWENLAKAEHAAGNSESAEKAWACGQQLRQHRTEATSSQQVSVGEK